MTMVIAFNAVPPDKGGLVAASIGVILTVGGVAGPLLSGKLSVRCTPACTKLTT
jgi:hypothetical protein